MANDNRRTPQLQRFLDGMQEALGISDEKAQILNEGSEHPYHCRCSTCLAWWVSMGPEHDETWGPFSAAEIKEANLTS